MMSWIRSACLTMMAFTLLSFAWSAPAKKAAPPTPPTITVQVDASEAPRKIFHAHLQIPVTAGPTVLQYPKWIPGEHGPTGTIADLAGLHISANGKELHWRRDLTDMFNIQVDVPAGATTLDVALDYLSPAEGGFSAGASATEKLTMVSWNQMLLYPKGWTSDQVMCKPSLKLPPGWKFGTSLEPTTSDGEYQQFAPVSLTMLVDSPVLTGQFMRFIPLADEPRVQMDIAADSPAALEMRPETEQHYKQLVKEAHALFGAHHYNHYDFLYTLSDHTAHFGLEHHQSSDDREFEDSLTDDDDLMLTSGLLPHEYVHSWNGKYRRPEGLATADYQVPMKGDMLWVYEGMTQYWGFVLTARSGLVTPENIREELARTAAYLDHWPGRSWRPLQDTADAAQVLYGTPDSWSNYRRSTDFYDEMILVWLEADTIIREQSKGQKSLDDFSKLFHGGASTPPKIVPYNFDEVVKTLNQVVPYDWAGFLRTRLDRTGAGAPLGGIENSGWKIVYTDKMTDYDNRREMKRKYIFEWYSIGLELKPDGLVTDALQWGPAAKAGIGPGMKVVAVNGRQFNMDTLRNAIRASKGTTEPLEFIVQNGEWYRTIKVDYHDGLRYPNLVRDESKPDVLSEILKSHAQ